MGAFSTDTPAAGEDAPRRADLPLAKVYSFHNGARFIRAEEDDAVTDACPDPKTPVVFEVRWEFED
jgi:hypothetical protein